MGWREAVWPTLEMGTHMSTALVPVNGLFLPAVWWLTHAHTQPTVFWHLGGQCVDSDLSPEDYINPNCDHRLNLNPEVWQFILWQTGVSSQMGDGLP